MFVHRRINRRHSEGSANDKRLCLTLLQEQMMYKVKMADKSMVCDAYSTQAINSNPVCLNLSDREAQKVVMHQPDWLKISSSNFLRSQPVLSSPSDIFAKMASRPIRNVSNKSALEKSKIASLEDTNATASHSLDKPSVVLKKISRKKSVPRHRCNRLNRSLTSALKPSNYSFLQVEEARRSKSLPPNSFELDASALNSEFTSDEGFDDVVIDTTRLRQSLASLDDAPWIPKGVEFAVTVEAYVYHNHDVCFPQSKRAQGSERRELSMN